MADAIPTAILTRPGLEYSRFLYDNVLDWYKSADTKAQVILTLNGLFITFLTTTVFAKRADFAGVLPYFGLATWICLSLLASCVAASVVAALYCLWSRVHLRDEIERDFRAAGLNVTEAKTYQPELMWFFQHLEYLKSANVGDRLRTIDDSFEIQARAAQIVRLSENVRKKHWAVNAGFTFFGAALILFLAAAASYVATL